MNMEKILFVLLPIVVFCLPGFTVSAQTDNSLFHQELSAELRQAGWAEEDVLSVMAELDQFSWDNLDRTSAQAAAISLNYAYERDSIVSAEEAALLAFEIARASSAMAQVGISRRDIARTAGLGTRSIIEKRESARQDSTGFQDLVAGEMLRGALQQSRVSAGSHARDKVHRILSNLPGPPLPDIPSAGKDTANNDTIDIPDPPGGRP